jgi:L-threonylcarbamoyladenylate synthase
LRATNLRQNDYMKFATPAQIEHAAAALQRGELVALPTETVYGLGADATNAAAIAKIFKAKGRPANHPLIVHVASGVALEAWGCDVPLAAAQLAAHFWPGPLTLILKKSPRIPAAVTGGQDTVGLRCPAHPIAQALLIAFAKLGSGAIAAPSANKFGHVSPTTAQHVRDEFGVEIGQSISLLDGGACDVGIESTILDLSRADLGTPPVLLRPGAISREQIYDVIGEMPMTREEDEANRGGTIKRPAKAAPRVSGSLAAHYAPHTPLKLVAGAQMQAEVDQLLNDGKRAAVLAFSARPKIKPSPVGVGVRNARRLLWITADTDAVGYAQGLYANLRTLDAAATTTIFVETPPSTKAWDAVNDRLGRAAVGSGKHATKSDA